jgi:GNAT superfamily N-acetyltransferase
MKEFSREHETELRSHPPRLPIRLADEHDEMAILDMCIAMWREQPYHQINMSKVAAMVRLAIQPGPHRRGILGVIGDRHDLKGGIFMLIDPIWYSDEWQLLEFFNFVRPEYRRMGFAQDLIGYAKQCSNELGIDLTVGVFSTVRTEAKCRLYRRWLPKIGEFFCYSPPNRPTIEQRIAAAMATANTLAAE